MKDIVIKIEFFSPWHCSSGLSAGAEADSVVIKDSRGLPYIPGKTLKGLLREAVEDYVSLSGLDLPLDATFGKNAEGINADQLPSKGTVFVGNATLPDQEADSIVSGHLTDFLYVSRATTAIDSASGIAKDHSLRTTEAAVPCTLYAPVMHVDNGIADIMQSALGLVKYMGTGRNRGMGRCRFTIQKGDES